MKAIILCGGKGTRIREHSERIPKPMFTIGDRPLLWHIMRTYAWHGVKEFVLCLGYKGYLIKDYFLNLQAVLSDFTVNYSEGSIVYHDDLVERDWKVTLAETGEHTMTGARLALVRKFIGDDPEFCVTYGDGLADVDIRRLIEFHREHGAAGTITAVHPMSRYGQLQLAGQLALGFHEKSYDENEWINGGFMIFNSPVVWRYFNDDPTLVLESGPLPDMVRDRQLTTYRHNGFWLGMDTVHEYDALTAMWKTGRAPWKVWE
jgi:glucose-1-phosphate cytidylyltransferase